MKAIVSFFRFLSIPAMVVGAACIWLGTHDWKVATAEVTISGKELFREGHPDVVRFRDSLRVDLWHASLREETMLGIVQPVRAVVPAWWGKDSGIPRIVVVSSAPEVLGPAVNSFMRGDTNRGDLTYSSTEGQDAGNLRPKFNAILQQQALKLGSHLKDTAFGVRWVEGVAVRSNDPKRVGINPIAAEYWEILTEDLPSKDRVYAMIGAGFTLIVAGIFVHLSAGRLERKRREEEEDELQNEKPLV